MIKLLSFILFFSTQPHSTNCGIVINKNYIFVSDSLSVSLIFKNDSTYQIRGRRSKDKWVGYGKWKKLGSCGIHFIPNEGLQIGNRSNQNNRVWITGTDHFFFLFNESAVLICSGSKKKIVIGDYNFELEQ